MNIVVHQKFHPWFHSYFLQGLEDVAESVSFADIGLTAEQATRVLAAELDGRRFAFDGDDTATRPDWFRHFAVVGMSEMRHIDQGVYSIIPIGPTFGISPRDSRSPVGQQFGRLNRPQGAKTRIKALLGRDSYYSHRARIQDYQPSKSDPHYVFFTAWAWTKHPEVNPPRARFLEAMQSMSGIKFEGGFAHGRRESPLGHHLSVRKNYSHAGYLDRLSRSVVAFNTPAVHGCLGWKLGEFLALGKAIVSLPLGDRVLPAPLIHGEHVHFIEDEVEAMQHSVALLASDGEYRHHLEQGARSWFEHHLTPSRVVSRVLDALP